MQISNIKRVMYYKVDTLVTDLAPIIRIFFTIIYFNNGRDPDLKKKKYWDLDLPYMLLYIYVSFRLKESISIFLE